MKSRFFANLRSGADFAPLIDQFGMALNDGPHLGHVAVLRGLN